jgi:transcriptional regulator with XRE-family HTH domain
LICSRHTVGAIEGAVSMRDERTFGRRLRDTRIGAGYSQSDLEEISGIPKARLSRYENGHVAPSIQTLERLARALKVSEAALLGDERAILEDFFNVLHERGVRIESTDQARTLANAVADMYFAMQRAAEAQSLSGQPQEVLSSAMAPVRDWAGASD